MTQKRLINTLVVLGILAASGMIILFGFANFLMLVGYSVLLAGLGILFQAALNAWDEHRKLKK